VEQFQKTIKQKGSIEGVGLHYGKVCELLVKPATSGGIVFYRKDLKTRPQIEASHKRVVSASYHTILEKNGIQVATVEHFLSALAALQVDHLSVEINSEELPILDGSAQGWIDFFESCKIQELPEKKIFFEVKKEVRVGDKNNYALFRPSKNIIFQAFIDFKHKAIKKQHYKFELNLEGYKKQIAACRTFGLEKNIAKLKKENLIKGATLDNAILLLDNGKVAPEQKLRFQDEFVRHKILDAIGDTYLAGAPIIGEYYGYKASHKLNVELVQKFLAS
jgi:UDP-3-O-[3-hydroxymyristoyl] N-acetylglucosamine deacetylase